KEDIVDSERAQPDSRRRLERVSQRGRTAEWEWARKRSYRRETILDFAQCTNVSFGPDFASTEEGCARPCAFASAASGDCSGCGDRSDQSTGVVRVAPSTDRLAGTRQSCSDRADARA